MNITSYVKKYGNESFDERPFSNVDALIMAQMGYLNWEILEKYNRHPINVKNIPDSVNVALNANEFDSKKSEALFLAMKNSKRFKDMKVRFVKKVDSIDELTQFFSITISLPNGQNVIVFRGTDLSLNGWKEDSALSFMDEIPSHSIALKYVLKVCKEIKGPFYIVGHSKGGNMAFYSAINLPNDLKRRLKAVYSFDGPGFINKEIYQSKNYLCVKRKLHKFVPKDSIVGMMLHTCQEEMVVESTYISIFQHDPFSWKINTDLDFVYCKNRTLFSRINQDMLIKFLEQLNEEERKETADAIFNLLGKPDQSLKDLWTHIPKTVSHFFKTYKHFPKEKRKKLLATVIIFVKTYMKSIKEITFKSKKKKVAS